MDLLAELRMLLSAFERAEVEYALCGGLAMAVYGVPRATMEIDVLVLTSDIEKARHVAAEAGFTIPAGVMDFCRGTIRIHRMSKPGGPDEECIPLDIIEVGDATRSAWESRQKVAWDSGLIAVVGKGGLESLKRLRNSLQDQADLAALEGAGNVR